MIFELFVGSEAVRRQVENSLRSSGPRGRAARPERRPRVPVRAVSAAALRGLAERLEPSAGHS